MSKKIISSALVLLMLVTAIACGSGEQQITGEELIDNVFASMENQETCRYEISMVYNMSGTMEGEYGEIDFEWEIAGVMDVQGREMLMDMNTYMNIRADTETEETSVIKAYILGDIAYVGLVSEVSPTDWAKGDVSEDFWEVQNYLNQQVELLHDAEVTIVGTEKVGGFSCYVAEISPDEDNLLSFMKERIEKNLPFEITEDSISNYSQKGWYAKDSFFPMKSHQEFDFTFDLGEDELTAHYIIEMLFSDYNKPVSIELPPEAEDAEYVGPIDL